MNLLFTKALVIVTEGDRQALTNTHQRVSEVSFSPSLPTPTTPPPPIQQDCNSLNWSCFSQSAPVVKNSFLIYYYISFLITSDTKAKLHAMEELILGLQSVANIGLRDKPSSDPIESKHSCLETRRASPSESNFLLSTASKSLDVS